MTDKLTFDLLETGANRYALRLTDPRQIAKLALDEGFSRPISMEPLTIVYDEGNGEIAPADGYDGMTPRGRIAMKIMAAIYCDALNEILARRAGEARPANENAFAGPRGLVFNY